MNLAASNPNDANPLVWGMFVRAVGVCYAVTFLSESSQILGLVGSQGILPIAEFIEVATKGLTGPYRYLRLPTLFWLNASDAFIGALPWIGAIASLLVVVGIASRWALSLCYLLHQSTVVAGGDFFFYPWDFLLLETTILALFVPSLRRVPSIAASGPPPTIVAFAIHFLLFRLQFGMGLHKFFDASDPGWADLSYVFHWQQAQPMPNAAAWYAYNYLPAWMHAWMSALTFVTEVPLPFLLLVPGRARLVAVLTIAVLHAGIAALGNFGTFQLVTLALCVPCLTDAQVRWVWRRLGLRERAGEPELRARPRADGVVGSIIALTAMLCGVLFTVRMMQPQGMTVLSNTRWLFAPEAEHSVTYPGMRLLRLVSPFFLSYPYGIFRESAGGAGPRRGIVFQGSADGHVWKTYENRFNPVEPIERAPQFFAPYQPRLDHMFIYEAGGFHFAYINGINPYYGARTPLPFLAVRLFEQSRDVRALFANDPFPDRPPAQLRVRVASYRFTTPDERAASGAWWVRSDETVIGPFDPAGVKALTAMERDAAARALRHVVEVEEWKRAGPPRRAVAAARVEPWMPPWKFWLLAAPGWIWVCAVWGRGATEPLRRRRRRSS